MSLNGCRLCCLRSAVSKVFWCSCSVIMRAFSLLLHFLIYSSFSSNLTYTKQFLILCLLLRISIRFPRPIHTSFTIECQWTHFNYISFSPVLQCDCTVYLFYVYYLSFSQQSFPFIFRTTFSNGFSHTSCPFFFLFPIVYNNLSL